uniref:DUF6881 domain-containing protein n=1 Tax=Bradyrhizobium sp. (strain ORS 278) TaxID=114615 RepID=UPI0005A06C5E|nr:hypothetical protein [Bradyrhizobium sp. ORS 278]
MSEKAYIRVRWLHDLEDEPVDLWSELDGDRFETRKLEIFRDGSIGFASATEATDRTGLGKIAVPPLDEIAQAPEFVAEEVSREEFELRWKTRHDC